MSGHAPSSQGWFASIPWDYEGLGGTDPAPPIVRQLLGENADVKPTPSSDQDGGYEPSEIAPN